MNHKLSKILTIKGNEHENIQVIMYNKSGISIIHFSTIMTQKIYSSYKSILLLQNQNNNLTLNIFEFKFCG